MRPDNISPLIYQSGSHEFCLKLTDMIVQLTARFDLPYIVTGKPSYLAVERALPPSSLLLPRHKDHVAFVERQLVFIGLLEVEAGLHHLLPASAVLRHLLSEMRWSATQSQASWGVSANVRVQDHTTDLDCRRREPLDLAEESACDDDDWLGDGVPDGGHDLSAAQSMDTQNPDYTWLGGLVLIRRITKDNIAMVDTGAQRWQLECNLCN